MCGMMPSSDGSGGRGDEGQGFGQSFSLSRVAQRVGQHARGSIQFEAGEDFVAVVVVVAFAERRGRECQKLGTVT